MEIMAFVASNSFLCVTVRKLCKSMTKSFTGKSVVFDMVPVQFSYQHIADARNIIDAGSILGCDNTFEISLRNSSATTDRLKESSWLSRLVPTKNNYLLASSFSAATTHGVLDVHCLDVKTVECPPDIWMVIQAHDRPTL